MNNEASRYWEKLVASVAHRVTAPVRLESVHVVDDDYVYVVSSQKEWTGSFMLVRMSSKAEVREVKQYLFSSREEAGQAVSELAQYNDLPRAPWAWGMNPHLPSFA